MADQDTCAKCGMEMEIASNPFELDGKRYCCPGCAHDTGCNC